MDKQWLHEHLRQLPSPPEGHIYTEAEAALMNAFTCLQRAFAIRVGLVEGDANDAFQKVDAYLDELRKIWGLESN